VKLQTSLYDASTGRNGGGIFQLVSKSGTNRLSGTGYYFLQNDALLANDFFFNRAGTSRSWTARKEASRSAARSCATARSSSAPTRARGPRRPSSTKRAVRSWSRLP
jgi:hypothetical protein